jgi:crotonobetainyl-CoA:carnitine CoA-transferase CaiB-like acyl-CoA transferase
MKPQRYRQIVEEIKQPMFWWKQFRPGAMENFNLSFDTVRKLIQHRYISVTGYGQSGDKKRCRRP